MSSSKELILEKSSLHDLFCKLFFENLFDGIDYVYMFVTRNETLLLNCNCQKRKVHAV